ncbi:MAG: hypothetical protein JWQ07_2960 [Ramlibacter sp.]|nr:hypothetical protein [Ramlibacter sp.]
MSYHPGKFTWFEHLSSDPAKARHFYEALFGWKVETMQGDGRSYDMIQNSGEGIGGLLAAPAGVPNHWASYLSVSDVDASYKAAVAAGAKSYMQPRDFPSVGRGATIADPTGAVISLWKSTQGDREDREQVPAGDWVWNELYTPDVQKSLAFYESVFGFTHDEMNMGPQGMYYVIKSADGKARGGVLKAPHADMPSMWMPYLRVEQADATAARIAPLGGKLMMPPQDVPTVGRICALFDPLGAPIAFIQPAVMP